MCNFRSKAHQHQRCRINSLSVYGLVFLTLVGNRRHELFQWSQSSGPIPAGNLKACADVYRKAASLLAAQDGLKGGIESYPIVFRYRHVIEAYLKALRYEFGSTNGASQPNGPLKILGTAKRKRPTNRTHDLCKLLASTIHISCRADKPLSARKEAVIGLNHANPTSSSFRYDEWMYDRAPARKGDTFDVHHFIDECEAAINEMDALFSELDGRRTAEIMAHESRLKTQTDPLPTLECPRK